VRSTIELARNLGLRTVAEGIEDRPTLEQIRSLGCELAQGYHISRPLPALELVNWWDLNTNGDRMPMRPRIVPSPSVSSLDPAVRWA